MTNEDFSDVLVKQAMEQRRKALEQLDEAKAANSAMVSRVRELRAAAVYLMDEAGWDPRASRERPWRVTEKAMDRLEAATLAIPAPTMGQRGLPGTNPPPEPPPDRG